MRGAIEGPPLSPLSFLFLMSIFVCWRQAPRAGRPMMLPRRVTQASMPNEAAGGPGIGVEICPLSPTPADGELLADCRIGHIPSISSYKSSRDRLRDGLVTSPLRLPASSRQPQPLVGDDEFPWPFRRDTDGDEDGDLKCRMPTSLRLVQTPAPSPRPLILCTVGAALPCSLGILLHGLVLPTAYEFGSRLRSLQAGAATGRDAPDLDGCPNARPGCVIFVAAVRCSKFSASSGLLLRTRSTAPALRSSLKQSRSQRSDQAPENNLKSQRVSTEASRREEGEARRD